MPSLRQRPEDITQLADQLLTRSFMATGRKPRALNDERAAERSESYGWPGNIRELKNALERAAILSHRRSGDGRGSSGPRARAQPCMPRSRGPRALRAGTGGLSLAVAMTPSDVSLEELEKQHIQHVLSTATTLEEAASILGINLSTLWRKRRRYGLE